MKSIIVFYSFSGNTARVADSLREYLEEKGTVEVHRLKAPSESKSFFAQCLQALFKKKVTLEGAPIEVGEFDLICLGTPVWAFAPTPAMRSYIDRCSGISGKRILLFITYGSGIGEEKCLNEMIIGPTN